ncbi:hypothetical protein [Erwinia phage vB_Ea277G]|nr:hypothetical protein [Erwinia phage vB_Ea277G]
MLSKGGKIRYRCCGCRSANIKKVHWGMVDQISYECSNCNSIRPWSTRLKIPIEKDNVCQQVHAQLSSSNLYNLLSRLDWSPITKRLKELPALLAKITVPKLNR